jgi:hypothetical protein
LANGTRHSGCPMKSPDDTPRRLRSLGSTRSWIPRCTNSQPHSNASLPARTARRVYSRNRPRIQRPSPRYHDQHTPRCLHPSLLGERYRIGRLQAGVHRARSRGPARTSSAIHLRTSPILEPRTTRSLALASYLSQVVTPSTSGSRRAASSWTAIEQAQHHYSNRSARGEMLRWIEGGKGGCMSCRVRGADNAATDEIGDAK